MSASQYWQNFRRRQLSRRALLRGAAVGGLGLATAAAIGCEEEEEAQVTPTATPTPTASPQVLTPRDVPFGSNVGQPNRTPKAGGTYRMSALITFPSIDPLKNAGMDPAQWHSYHSSYLLTHDASPGVTHFEEPIVGDLSDEWEEVDPVTFVFHLNPEAKWNDRPPANGRKIEPEDIKFSFERWASGGLTGPRFAAVDRIETPDPATVRIILKDPTPEILDVFAFEFHPILNPEYIESLGGDMGNGSTQYVGSGPFMATEWDPRVSAMWERNPTYFGKDKAGRALPYLEKIKWTWITDPAARRAAFDAGDIDSVQIDDLGLFDSYAKRDDVFLIKGSTAAGQLIFGLNQRNKPFDDPRVRQAISMAIDRPTLNEQIYGGASEPALPLPPRAIGLDKLPGYDDLPSTYRHNPEKAKALLAEAGFADGLDIGNLTYWFLNQSWENQALLIQDMLKKVGITSTPRKIDRSEFFKGLFGGTWEGALMEHATNPGVSSQAWVEWMHTDAPNNFWGISDPEIDALIEKLRVELDEDARRPLFKQVQDRATAQVHRPWINQLASITATKNYVINPASNSFLTFKQTRYKYLWLDK